MSTKNARSPSWLGKLNGGQLDFMWQFLQFHGDKPTVSEVEALEENLDSLRVMMIQKNGGQEGRSTKTEGAVDFADMGCRRKRKTARGKRAGK